MVQYNQYSGIPEMVRDIVANKVSLLDQYVLFQTGEYEYTALIKNTSTGEVKQYRFYRTGTYSQYAVEETEGTWEYTYHNEYYTYSNMKFGSSLELPVVDGVTAHASIIMCVTLMFAIIYKGVLFPCLARKRKGL